MELVIKIPEEEYRWIRKSDETAFADISSKECMLHAIKNGTPLPEGHGRLIDADSFVQEHPLAFVRDVINDAPTIIAADRGEEDEEKVSD